MTSYVSRAQAEKGRKLLERLNGGPLADKPEVRVIVCTAQELDQDKRRELRDWIKNELAREGGA